LMGVALLVGLLAIGAAIYFSAKSDIPSSSSYSGYEPVLKEWLALSRIKVAKIKHLAARFYAVRYRSRKKPEKQYCVMVDVSTTYKNDGRSTTGSRGRLASGASAKTALKTTLQLLTELALGTLRQNTGSSSEMSR
jgi:hypothetical protein